MGPSTARGIELTQLYPALRDLAGIWNDIVKVEGDVVRNGDTHLHDFWYPVCHNVYDLHG